MKPPVQLVVFGSMKPSTSSNLTWRQFFADFQLKDGDGSRVLPTVRNLDVIVRYGRLQVASSI